VITRSGVFLAWDSLSLSGHPLFVEKHPGPYPVVIPHGVAAPYPLTGQTLYRLPTTASTASLTNEATPVSVATTMGQIQTSVTNYGWSVVAVSPDTYCGSSGGSPDGITNWNTIANLRTLVTELIAGGYTIVTVSEIANLPPRTPTPLVNPVVGCNCVAFRLDDIQDYWITPAMNMIIQEFITNDAPLSIGIIANAYGTDPYIVGVVTEAITSPLIEVMSHGWNHEDFSTFTLDQQITLLTESKNKIYQVHQRNVTDFMPPFNTIDYNTYLAAVAAGYTQLCSEVSQDLPPYGYTFPGLLRTPIGAQTSAVDAAGQYVGIPHTDTMDQIATQMQAYGYAAVMMHPQEFSPLVNEAPQNGINATMQTELGLLIAAVRAAGYTMTNIGGLRNYICTANPSNCP